MNSPLPSTMADPGVQKSLEEMLSSDVDESAISAIVGSLENSFESASSTPSSVEPVNSNTNSTNIVRSTPNSHSLTNNSIDSSAMSNSSQLMTNNVNQMYQHQSLNSSTSGMNSNSYVNSSLSNHNVNSGVPVTSMSVGQSVNINTSSAQGASNPAEMGKRILLSANSQAVNTSIPNMNQSSLIKMSSLTNGTMTPPQSPSVTHTSLQQQQTIPVGQQVALVTSQISTSQSHVNTVSIRPSTTTVPLSAISSSQLVIAPNNKMTTVAQKSNPTLLIQSKDGQPMLIGHPTSMTGNIRPNIHLSGTTTSLPSSMISTQASPANIQITAPGSGIMLGPRHQQQQIQLQQLGAGNQGHNGSNIQLQIVNVNSPSRPTLTMPPVSVTGTSVAAYSASNIMTGTNASMQGNHKTAGMAPRVVQLPPNVRLSPHVVRPGTAPGFASPLALPNLVRAGTFFVKTENGQVHMVNVGPQTLQPGASPAAAPATLRLQVPGASGTVTGVGPTVSGTPSATTIRTGLAGNQIVMPVTLATTPVNNTTNHNAVANHPNNSSSIQNKPMAAGVPGVSSHAPLTVHTTTANTQAASSAPSQMSPSTAKKKCKNFLSTLIRLASDQPDNVANNVKTLIQGLIDDTIQPEDFTNQLQKELNSSPQPCLVPFLKKSLPYLRYSLMKEELTIDGVRPPPSTALSIPSTMTPQALAQLQHLSSPVSAAQRGAPNLATQTVRLIAPTVGGQHIGPNLLASTNVHGAAQHVLTSLPPNNSSNLAPIVLSSVNSSITPTLISNVTTSTPSSAININNTAPLPPNSRLPLHHQHQSQTNHHPQPSPTTTTSSRSNQNSTSGTKSKSSSKSKAKEKAEKKAASAAAAAAAAAAGGGVAAGPVNAPPGERSTSSFRDDDDINDVAAMGGVNLQEESQRILAGNAEIIGQQIRSCKDENFLYTSPLHSKINNIVKRYEMDDCSQEVVSLISHAVQERLKTLVEKLGVIAEHRQEQFKNNKNYEVIQDVKAQVQFLQELDRIEKRRHEEQEREVLIKAAKSRSKVDDPDHIAIKARAKEMQRQELEEIRQREANETALQAIGNPKKRLKTMASNSFTSSPSTGSSLFGSFVSKPIKRIKRVTMKDVYFLMERDKDTIRSHMLYKTYAR